MLPCNEPAAEVADVDGMLSHVMAQQPIPPATSVSRRRLLGGAATLGFLAACGSSDDEARPASTLPGADPVSEPVDDGDATFTLVQRFPQNVQEPGMLRLPLSLSTGAAELLQDVPSTLSAQVVDVDGGPIGEPIIASRRDVAPAPYYDFRTTLADPGFYALVVENGPATGASFQVMEPGSVPIPSPGEQLDGFDTPTFDDDQGFAAVCTRSPEPCPFHDRTLTEALSTGLPVAYYVGTPAFCSTGSCAPALEALIDLHAERSTQFVAVHAEVFSDDAATEVAPAVLAVGMTFEPAIFLTDANGVIVERLDAVWDRSELAEALDRALG